MLERAAPVLALALALSASPLGSHAGAQSAVDDSWRRAGASPAHRRTEARRTAGRPEGGVRILLETDEPALPDPRRSARPVAALEASPLPPIGARAASTPPATATPPWTESAMRTPRFPGEGWRIQVGAFRDAARAEAQIAALEALAAGPGADPVRLVTPTLDRSPALYRAQMSGFVDRAAAESACFRIEASGAPCFVVTPSPP